MSNGSNDQGHAAGGIAPQPGARPRSIEERRRLVAESLHVGNPANRARTLPDQADPTHDCPVELRVDDIRPYDHNPRRVINTKFAEIKESIRATGIRNPLTVTRRPGEKHFIVEAGGNTRLLAVQQLWAETRDTRFEKLTVLFRPWRSEAHVLTAHLIENEQRGELTFWDKANGVLALKTRFEEEKGRALSLRQLEEELKCVGLSVSATTLAQFLYATTRLRTLGEAIPVLSYMDVKAIHPRLNLMKRYAQARGGTAETTLYESVFEPVFLRCADYYRNNGTFTAATLCQACEDALAQYLGEDVVRLRMVLDALAQSPQASVEALLEPDTSTVADLRTPPKPTPGDLPGDPALVNQVYSGTELPGNPAPVNQVYSGIELPGSPAGVNQVYSGTEAIDGPDGQHEGDTPPARPQPGAALLGRLKASVGRLAQLANVAGCLQAWDAAPLGYYMELPAAPFEEDRQQRLAARAWWLLARLSGQFNERVLARLPEASRWRELGARAGGLDHGDPGHAAVELSGIRPLDSEFFDWLLGANDEAANACWEVLIAARASAAAGNR